MLAVRRHVRSRMRIPLEFTLKDARHVIFGFAQDISPGGLFVETEFPAPTGSIVTLRLKPPDAEDDIIATGRVRWRRRGGMGVEFTSTGVMLNSAEMIG